MPKRSSKKKPTDINLIAAQIIEAATAPNEGKNPTKKKTPKKNPAAVALGRLGGIKGGKARAEKLSSEERQAIARKAANARWNLKD